MPQMDLDHKRFMQTDLELFATIYLRSDDKLPIF
jgi:hypothetical protein